MYTNEPHKNIENTLNKFDNTQEKIDNAEIGKRIRLIRLKLGCNMEEFATKLDPPPTKGTISKWENGKYLPNPGRLWQIAELGGVSLSYLTTGEKKLKDTMKDNNELKKINDQIKLNFKKVRELSTSNTNDLFSNLDFEKMNSNEIIFLENSLLFLENYNSANITTLTAFLLQLNKLKNESLEDDFSQEKLDMYINDLEHDFMPHLLNELKKEYKK